MSVPGQLAAEAIAWRGRRDNPIAQQTALDVEELSYQYSWLEEI